MVEYRHLPAHLESPDMTDLLNQTVIRFDSPVLVVHLLELALPEAGVGVGLRRRQENHVMAQRVFQPRPKQLRGHQWLSYLIRHDIFFRLRNFICGRLTLDMPRKIFFTVASMSRIPVRVDFDNRILSDPVHGPPHLYTQIKTEYQNCPKH